MVETFSWNLFSRFTKTTCYFAEFRIKRETANISDNKVSEIVSRSEQIAEILNLFQFFISRS